MDSSTVGEHINIISEVLRVTLGINLGTSTNKWDTHPDQLLRAFNGLVLCGKAAIEIDTRVFNKPEFNVPVIVPFTQF